MWRNIFGQAVYQLIIYFLILFLGMYEVLPLKWFATNDDDELISLD